MKQQAENVQPPPIPGHARPGADGLCPPPNPLYRLAMAVPYALTAGLVALLVYSHVYDEPFRVSTEDGFVEWATIVAFALCGLLGLTAAITGWRRLTRAQRVLVILLTVVAFLAVGEELSWGQRYFGFAPPESMKSGGKGVVQMGHNDVTWHNLSFELGPLKFSLGGMLFGIPLLAGIFVHGVWLPLGVRRGGPKATAFVRKLGLFLPPVHLGVLLLAGAVLFHYRKIWNHTDAREYKEFLVPAVYCFMLLHAYFRERKPLNTAVTAAALALLAAGLVLSLLAVLP